jgi:hypothetical protein
MNNTQKPLNERHKYILGYMQTVYESELETNGGWCSPTLIGKVYGVKFLNRSDCHSSTGSPILKYLCKMGIVERNSKGWYRYIAK